jgi:hypothetical protein
MGIMSVSDELRMRLGPVGIWMPRPERIGVDPAAGALTAGAAGQLLRGGK